MINSIIWAFTLFALLCPLYKAACGEVCTELSHFDCTVCTTECDEQYTYGTCKERYCSRSETRYTYSNGRRRSTTTCVQYSFYNHTQAMCIASCCGDAGVGVSSFQGGFLGQCIEENKRLTTQTGIIIGCVLGGIALIVGVVLFFYWRKNHS